MILAAFPFEEFALAAVLRIDCITEIMVLSKDGKVLFCIYGQLNVQWIKWAMHNYDRWY